MRIELILVPYEVERDDTPMARGPLDLADGGLEDNLRESGAEVSRSLVWSRAKGERDEIVASVVRETARAVARASSRNRFPVVLSGGCLPAVGVVGGLQRGGQPVSILWVDAHGDFNTPETSPSGYWEGMALAILCGRALSRVARAADLMPVPLNRVAHLGGRDLDAPEREAFSRLNMTVVPPSEVGPGVAERLRSLVHPGQELYLHIDLDGLDPADAPAVSFPVQGGVRVDDLLSLLRALGPPTALTLAALRFKGATDEEASRTVETCARLVRETAMAAEGERQRAPA